MGSRERCRLCYTQEAGVIPLYGWSPVTNPEGFDYQMLIWSCLGIKVTENDGLPQSICEECRGNLLHVREFITIARNTARKYKTQNEEPFQGPIIDLTEEEPPAIRPLDSAPVWACKACNIISATRTELREHLVDVHASVDLKKCKVCYKHTFKFNDLLSHLEVRHSSATKPFQCEACDRSFSSKRLFTKHAKSHGLPKKQTTERLPKRRHSLIATTATPLRRSERIRSLSRCSMINDSKETSSIESVVMFLSEEDLADIENDALL